jgi:hypothetical protein
MNDAKNHNIAFSAPHPSNRFRSIIRQSLDCMTALMFCKSAIVLFGAAIICAVATDCSCGAAAAFSDDGNGVYLLDSKLPKGTALDVDLTNFTTKQLNLGVTTDVRGVANAPRALLFVTEKSLYRRLLPVGEVGKTCDAPAGSYFADVACNRPKDFRDWPAYYLREQKRKSTSLVLRRVNESGLAQWRQQRSQAFHVVKVEEFIETFRFDSCHVKSRRSVRCELGRG